VLNPDFEEPDTDNAHMTLNSVRRKLDVWLNEYSDSILTSPVRSFSFTYDAFVIEKDESHVLGARVGKWMEKTVPPHRFEAFFVDAR